MDKGSELQKQLLETFWVEVQENLTPLAIGLMELEKPLSPKKWQDAVEVVFRQVHSLKGAARSVEMGMIEAICQGMETIFSRFKKHTLTPTREIFDLLLESLDAMGVKKEGMGEIKDDLLGRLEKAGNVQEFPPDPQGKSIPLEIRETPGQVVSSDPHLPIETVRIPTEKLVKVLLQAEEMVSAKLSAHQRSQELRKLQGILGIWEKKWKTLEHHHGNSLEKSQDFLRWNGNFFKALQTNLVQIAKAADQDSRTLGVLVDSLLEDTKKILMFPFSTLLDPYPKIVRDLARAAGKDVTLTVEGGDIQIDKRILEELKDPLLHMVRNALDHGFEKPEVRKTRGKVSQGILKIRVAPWDDKIILTIRDDGAGIPISALREALPHLGVDPREVTHGFSDQDIIQSLFQSGVSSRSQVTTLSGRGLGLAIVKEKVEALGGSVAIETSVGAGTLFSLILPLTIATFRGVLVRCGGREFIAPTNQVERVTRVKGSDIKTVEGKGTINLEGKPVCTVQLSDALELPPLTALGFDDTTQVIVLSSGGTRIAFLVEEVLGEQEVLQKSLGPQLARVRNILGATILGSGKLVPILNVSDLIKTSMGVNFSPATPDNENAHPPLLRKNSILVVEDSITTRTLLKNILQSSGYTVVTAVDGMDAWGKLKSSPFDGVVSDLNMPRMDGFELTAKIRKDSQLKNLPVVLVSSLSSLEDKERGIDVGANAFIVKGHFDQSDLLQALRRLL